MSNKLYRNKKTSLIISFVLIIFVLIAGMSALFFLNDSQDLRQQAWVGINDAGEKCIGGDCETEKLDFYVSKEGNYRVRTLGSIWEKAKDSELEGVDGNDISLFTFRNEIGFATVFLDSFEYTEEEAVLSVDGLAIFFEDRFKDTNDSYVGVEIVDLGFSEVIRYEFTEEILGQSATYYEYVIPGETRYIEAEVRSTISPFMEKNIASFLDALEFPDEFTGLVKGANTEEVVFAESEITELVKPSVANILYVYCKEIRISQGTPTAYLQSSYPFCSGSFGSGFVVDGSGLLATNGHVVRSYPEQELIGGLNGDSRDIAVFIVDFVREALATQGIATTPEEGVKVTVSMLRSPSGVQVLVKSMYELLETNAIEIVPTTEKYFVNLGTEAFEFSEEALSPDNISNFVKDKDAIFQAELAGINYANMFKKDVVFNEAKPEGSDVALLKISDDNYTFPSLNLGEASELKDGDSILVIGFPGIVSGSKSGPALIDYESSSAKATVTRGIVSSMKKDVQGNNLIQTDAIIGHGNSGGPAFNSKGEVIGIATYGIAGDVGSFNFLRDIEDLKKLAEESASLEESASATYQNWETALGYYWDNRFTKSLAFLDKVEESYPVHPTVGEIEKSAEESIAAGEDVDLMFGMQKSMVYAIGGLLSVLIIGVGAFIFIKKKKKAVVLNPVAAPQAEPKAQEPVVPQVAPKAQEPAMPIVDSTMQDKPVNPVAEEPKVDQPIN